MEGFKPRLKGHFHECWLSKVLVKKYQKLTLPTFSQRGRRKRGEERGRRKNK